MKLFFIKTHLLSKLSLRTVNANYIFLYNIQLGKLKLVIYYIFINIKRIIIYYYNFVCNKSTLLFNWFNTFICIIIYIGIFILITTNTPIYINMEVWTNMAQFVLMKIGLIKVKLINCNYVVVLANYRSIYGIKSYILLCAIECTIVSSLFILCNIHYIILSILGIIWTKAFVINFYKKHLAPFAFLLVACWRKLGPPSLNSNTSESKNSWVNEWIQYIWNNRVAYIDYILKLILITWLIVIILRCWVSTLFIGSSWASSGTPGASSAFNDNFILNGLVILLPLPICSYLVNFVSKKIKKETITSKDYYLYNESVVDSVNLYRMAFILCINYVVRNYFYIYYGIIIILIILLLIILFIYYIFYIRPNTLSGLRSSEFHTRRKLASNYAGGYVGTCVNLLGISSLLKLNSNCNEVAGNKHTMLKSNTGEVIALITAFVGIAPILQDACNTGYDRFMNHTGRGKGHINWSKLPFSNGGQYCIGKPEGNNRTVNFLSRKDPLYITQERPEDIELFNREKLMLKDSPILNMAYLLKNNEATLRSPDRWQIMPINFFNNRNFHGSISQSGKGKFLIFVLIRKDLDRACTFMPSFFLPDNTVEGQQRIRDIVDLLEIKYNILIPKGSIRKNGLMLFTQAESIGENGLVKLWRPSLAYTDPEVLRRETRVRDYYKLDNSELTRLDNFNYKEAIDLIKNLVVKNSVQELKKDEETNHMKELITNEVVGDRVYRYVIRNFINWGRDLSPPDEYVLKRETILRENEFNPDKFTPQGLIKDLEDRTKDQIRRLKKGKSKVLTPLEELTKIGETYNLSRLSNHVSFNSNDQILYARRNIPVDWSITKWDLSFRAYFSIAQQGIIEGFKSTRQGLGLLNQEFHFPLHESRQEIVSSIAKRYNIEHPTNIPTESICAVSINRFTFEFMEVRTDSNVFGYLLADGRDHRDNCEIFSLIDTQNDSSVFPAKLNTGIEDKILPKHDYHFLEDKDEHSIRKFMDYIYKNDNDYLSYKSDISNNDVLEDVMDIETLETLMEHFDLNNKARRIRVFKVGEQSSDNNKLIKRMYKWVFKPTQTADFGLKKRTVLDEWEDEVLFGDIGPRNPIDKWARRPKGVRMIPKEFTIGRRLIEIDRQATLRKEVEMNNTKIRLLKTLKKGKFSEMRLTRADLDVDQMEMDSQIKKDIDELERIVQDPSSSKKRKRK